MTLTSSAYQYKIIAEAIEFVKKHFRHQPSLEEIANHVCLSPIHFQKIFSEWAGVSPKKFLQHITLQEAKSLLRKNQLTLFDTAMEIGMSGTGRLHDLFVNIEQMTPAEYKNGGDSLTITYQFFDSTFGHVMIAATQKGVCFLHFVDDENQGLLILRKEFPNAQLNRGNHPSIQSAFRCINDSASNEPINLHIKGTPFQLKVWQALLQIPEGRISTYSSITNQLHNPTASRAVGNAIGQNPIAMIIPCHRIIRGDGGLGGYMWGTTRKSALLAVENCKLSEPHKEK